MVVTCRREWWKQKKREFTLLVSKPIHVTQYTTTNLASRWHMNEQQEDLHSGKRISCNIGLSSTVEQELKKQTFADAARARARAEFMIAIRCMERLRNLGNGKRTRGERCVATRLNSDGSIGDLK